MGVARRVVLIAAALVLSGDTRRNADVVHTGPARQSPWYPGKPKVKPPDWLYENGPIVGAVAVCACSKPRDWEVR